MSLKPGKKNLLTPEGYQELVQELEYLTTVRRREIAELIRQAKSDGDVMENAAYEEAKVEQAFLEGRIKTLENLLRNAVVVANEDRVSDGTVTFGSTVTVQAPDGERPETYQLVGSAEADPASGRISVESPLGKALLGHKVGEEVVVETPSGLMRFRILHCE
ncbi:MAG: transcription elongation factor GreA [Anaerolineae bacterium]